MTWALLLTGVAFALRCGGESFAREEHAPVCELLRLHPGVPPAVHAAASRVAVKVAAYIQGWHNAIVRALCRRLHLLDVCPPRVALQFNHAQGHQARASGDKEDVEAGRRTSHGSHGLPMCNERELCVVCRSCYVGFGNIGSMG
ncbi:hypothetical protein BRADI_3g40857v3 [Brachypodium distachyon]|uniref:Secreted protein n=1 Tax=Brachypodium distachyon TaxID=15368 RepID=A0A2K2D2F0_BRADI|nr:hypothetical protein BRADI_3g40857v3 [Brachypodium distachyon]